MNIIIRTPHDLPETPRYYRVWVDAGEPDAACAVDACHPGFAPSAGLRHALDRGDETSWTFALYYELELDAVEACVFDTLCRRARANGLMLVSQDRLTPFILRRYLIDWAACRMATRTRLHRRARSLASIAGVVYQQARLSGVSHYRARGSARAAMRQDSEKPPNTT